MNPRGPRNPRVSARKRDEGEYAYAGQLILAGNSTVRTCLQHEVAGDVCGVRDDFADFWRDGFRDSCGSVAGKRMYHTADIFSGAAAVRRFGRGHCGGELWAALDQ